MTRAIMRAVGVRDGWGVDAADNRPIVSLQLEGNAGPRLYKAM